MGESISVDDLKEWINDNEQQLSNDTDRKFGIFTEDIMKAIEQLPSAQPKEGKWVKADRQQYFRKHYPASQCSICGWRKNYSGKYNYCPSCGADMRKEE